MVQDFLVQITMVLEGRHYLVLILLLESSIISTCQLVIQKYRSSGKFSDGTLSRWTDDTIYLIESILGTKEKVILVGHGKC